MITVLVAAAALAGTLEVPSTYSTIQEAIDIASDDDVIRISPGTYVEALTISGASRLTLEGTLGPADTILVGDASSQEILRTLGSADITFRNLTFDGQSQRRAMRLDNDGGVLLESCHVRNGHTTTNGGGVLMATMSDLVVTDSVFQDNVARRGGHVYANGNPQCQVEIERTTLSGGEATDEGGAIYLGCSASMTDVQLLDNGADRNGGAIYMTSPRTLEIRRSLICHNHSTDGGGAIFMDNGDLDVSNNLFLGNQSSSDGGAIAMELSTTLTSQNNHYVSNTSDGSGQAIDLFGTGSLLNDLIAHHPSDEGLAFDDGSDGAAASHLLFHDNAGGDTNADVSFQVSADPELRGPVTDCDVIAMVPAVTSPARDAGSPSLLDADGSPSDIGAFGGPDPFPLDADSDGFALPEDCDDNDASVFPGAAEACNGRDDDCDGEIPPDEVDEDGDGDRACSDCDDGDDTRASTLTEVPCDQIDNDCDDTTPDAQDCPTSTEPTDDPSDPAEPLPPRWYCGTTPAAVGAWWLVLCTLLVSRGAAPRSAHGPRAPAPQPRS
ncbi:MAG: hypothetical protein KTR31_38005 [Myxococcales bacterium]|nr:hypothetical protein [Myxococcales bacterium]